MLNRSKLWAIALLAAAFIAGIAVGAGAEATFAEDRGRTPRPSYVDRLNDELTLSAAQRDSVAAILEEYESAMHDLWSEFRPRMDTIRLGIRERIGAALTAEQQASYQELTRRMDSTRSARERHSGRR